MHKSPILDVFMGKKYQNFSHYALIIFLNFLAALLEGASFAFILLGLSSLGSDSGNAIQTFGLTSWIPTESILSLFEKTNSFIVFIALAILFQAMRGGLAYLCLYVTANISLKIQTEAQSRVYRQIFSLSFSSVNRYKIGDLVEYTKTPSIFIQIFMEYVNTCVVSGMLSFVTALAMLLISVKLTLIAVTLFSVFIFFQRAVIRKIVANSNKLSNELADLSMLTVPNLEGMRIIHTFSKQNNVLVGVKGVLDKIAKSSKKVQLWNKSITSINELIGIFLLGVILISSFLFLEEKNETVLPILMTFAILTYRLATRLHVFLSHIGAIATCSGNIRRFNEILDPVGKEFYPKGGQKISKFEAHIQFEDVTFQYPDQTRIALNNLSFKVPKNSFVAFVGPSGGGKSSIIDLIIRLYEPTQGRISMNDQCISKFDLENWRSLFGVVSQESFLFNTTITDNIRFGNPYADMREVVEAAEMSGAHMFIDRLPQGYETHVGEKGYRLSGGEKQRIALARAILKRPQVLILDEATSNLDSISEQLIQKALKQFKGTIISIAHRLSTVMEADKIFVIENGSIVEIGTHLELLARNGSYSHLWSLQS